MVKARYSLPSPRRPTLCISPSTSCVPGAFFLEEKGGNQFFFSPKNYPPAVRRGQCGGPLLAARALPLRGAAGTVLSSALAAPNCGA
jgi:hypothetical protein